MKNLRKWKWCYIVLTIAVMALGICLIVWPDISAEALCSVCGIALLIVGAARIICYFQRGISVLWHRYELPMGLIDVLLGIYFLSRPANVMLILPVIVGVVIIIDSVFKLQTSLELRQAGARRWGITLIFAVLSIFMAVFLIRNPFEGTMTLMVYLGISLVIDAVQSLYFIHNVAKNIRKLAPIEAEFREVE